MADELIGYKPYAVTLEKWHLETTIVRTDDGRVYFAIRPLCRALGIGSPSQIEALQADEQYTEALHAFKIPTDGGMQETMCIRKRECAWWLAHISPKRVKAEVRGRLEEFQADLMAEADRLAFGNLAGVLRDGALQVYQPIRGELHFGCPRCGAPLCFVMSDNGLHLRVNAS